MKKLFTAFLIAGTTFLFANEKEVKENVATKNVEKTCEVKATVEEKLEDFATCTRCVRRTETIEDLSTGETTSTTVQFCYEVACPF